MLCVCVCGNVYTYIYIYIHTYYLSLRERSFYELCYLIVPRLSSASQILQQQCVYSVQAILFIIKKKKKKRRIKHCSKSQKRFIAFFVTFLLNIFININNVIYTRFLLCLCCILCVYDIKLIIYTIHTYTSIHT